MNLSKNRLIRWKWLKFSKSVRPSHDKDSNIDSYYKTNHWILRYFWIEKSSENNQLNSHVIVKMHPHSSRAIVSLKHVKHFSPPLSPQPHTVKPREAKLRLMVNNGLHWCWWRTFVTKCVDEKFKLTTDILQTIQCFCHEHLQTVTMSLISL